MYSNIIMKSILTLFGVSFTVIQSSAQDISFDSRFSPNVVFNQLFEMYRGLMKLGDVEKNIPIMDPYIFNADKAHVLALIDSEVNITNGVISGLSNFRLEDFAFLKDEVALEVTIKIPLIKFKAEYYEMKGEIFKALPIAGSGIFSVLANDVTIYSKLYLKQSDDGKSVTIKKLQNSSFDIEKILSHTEFDKNINDVLNAMADDLLARYLTRFSKFIAKKYEDYAVISLNSIFNEYDTWSILATILH